MKIISLSIAIVLLSAYGQTVAAGVEQSVVEKTVREAADICRSTMPPPAPDKAEAAEAERYMETITRLIDKGNDVVPALRALISSGEFDPYERSMAEMLIARIQHPEVFHCVAPYYVPEMQDRFTKAALRRSHLPPPASPVLIFRPLTLELLDPKKKKEWEQFLSSDEYKKLVEIKEKYERLSKAPPPEGNRAMAIELYKARHNELSQLKPETRARWSQLLVCSPVRPNPKYLLAWEEALARPVPWQLKEKFAALVVAIKDTASAPVLGQVLRQSIVANPNSRVDRRAIDEIGRHVIFTFASKPDRDYLRELSETLELCESVKSDKARSTEWMIGLHIGKSVEWQKLLKELESDDDFKDAVKRIRSAVDKHAKKK